MCFEVRKPRERVTARVWGDGLRPAMPHLAPYHAIRYEVRTTAAESYVSGKLIPRSACQRRSFFFITWPAVGRRHPPRGKAHAAYD